MRARDATAPLLGDLSVDAMEVDLSCLIVVNLDDPPMRLRAFEVLVAEVVARVESRPG
jgi:hypothetical protein